MKCFHMLFMLVIGMITFTITGATHTNWEQKQKPEFTKGISQDVNAVKVLEYQVADVSTNATIENTVGMKFTTIVKPIKYTEAIRDVGWQSKSNIFYNYFYKEKLNSNRNYTAVDIGYHSRSNC